MTVRTRFPRLYTTYLAPYAALKFGSAGIEWEIEFQNRVLNESGQLPDNLCGQAVVFNGSPVNRYFGIITKIDTAHSTVRRGHSHPTQTRMSHSAMNYMISHSCICVFLDPTATGRYIAASLYVRVIPDPSRSFQ